MENMDKIQALIAGEDADSVFPLGEIEPITFDLDDIEIDSSLAGYFDIRFTYKMYGKEYTTESFSYKVYCRFWCAVRPLRHLFMRVRVGLAKIKRQMINKRPQD